MWGGQVEVKGTLNVNWVKKEVGVKVTSLLQRLAKSVPRNSASFSCTFLGRHPWTPAFYCAPTPTSSGPGCRSQWAGSHGMAMHPSLNTCEVLCTQK